MQHLVLAARSGVPALLALATVALLTGALLAAGSAPVAAQSAPRPCSVDKVVAPDVVPLGYSTRVTLTVAALCASDTAPLHVVLVLDGTASMAGDKMAAQKLGVRAFVQGLSLAAHRERQVAIVQFTTGGAKTACRLSNDPAVLIRCLDSLGSGGSSSIDAGIQVAIRELSLGRPKSAAQQAIQEAIVVVANGANTAGCDPQIRAMSQAKAQGILIATAGFVPEADRSCLLATASSPRFAFWIPGPAEVPAVFVRLAAILAGPTVDRLVVEDELAPNMRLEPDTVDPPEGLRGPTSLRWTWLDLPAGTVTMTYRVTPLELGEHPVSLWAKAVVQVLDVRSELAFPQPRVRVVSADGLPTPTPFPWRTPTLTPFPSPTLTPRPAAQSTPAPRECPGLARLAPPQAIADALANPSAVAGWGQTCNLGLPPGPSNPLRRTLGLRTVGLPYHPLFNRLLFKCGCP